MPSVQTVLEQIEVNVLNGYTFIQWRKQLVADNGTVVASEPHRTALAPEQYMPDGTLLPPTDRSAQLANVDAHLAELGFPPTSPADRALIASHDTRRLTVKAAKPQKGNPNV